MYNSQAFSTTYTRGSTRVCRMETCKDHHGKISESNVQLQPFTKTCKRKIDIQERTQILQQTCGFICSDSRTVYNSQAFSTTYTRGSTRVCRMETCKDHHGKISESNVQLQPFTKTCKRKINIQERTQILQQTCGFICSDSRTVDNSQAFSTTYTRGSTRVCRMETCKDHHGKISESNVQLQPFTKTCKRKINIQERTRILQQTCGFICSDSRTVDNSQAFSTTYTRGSTRVCRMETCKDHHGKNTESNVHFQPFTKTCKRKINIQERTQILQQTCGFICSDSRTVYNSQAFSTTYTRGSTRVCRMETCKDHHGTEDYSNVHFQPFTKTCKRKINIQERTQILQQTCGFICSDSRTVYNSQAFSTTYTRGSTRVCRMETCKDHHGKNQ